MLLESFRLPETLEPDSGSSDILDEWIRKHGNNLNLQADDVPSLTQRAQEKGIAYVEAIQSTIRAAEQGCKAETDEEIESMKVGVYLSTLMVFSAVLGEQPQKKKAPSKKKGKPGEGIDIVTCQLLALFKMVCGTPKPQMNEIVHGEALVRFCQQRVCLPTKITPLPGNSSACFGLICCKSSSRMQALKVCAHSDRASQLKEPVAAILGSAFDADVSFDTRDSVTADLKAFLEEDAEGPVIAVYVSQQCPALGKKLLEQVVDDMGCMESKDDVARVGNYKEYLGSMAKSCLELLLVGSVMVSLNSILDSEKDMFATTILQCFLQSALQDREESRVDSETAHFSKKAVVEVFKLRLRDKTCAVRVMALQCISQLAQNEALPVEQYSSVTDCARMRLSDNLVSARKQALQTMEELVARNPFGFVLTQDVVFNRMEEDLKQLKNKQKLRRVSIAPAKTQPEDADAENDGQENAENEDPNVAEERLKEEEAIQAIVDKHQPACDFVNAVEKMVPQLEELLSHNVESDVSGAVAELNAGLLKYLRAFDVSGASTSLTKALKLVSSSLPSARGVIIDMFVEVYLNEKDSAEIVAALLQLLESEPTLALEKAIKTCLVSAMEAGTDIAMHQLPGICIKAAASQMRGQRPQAQDVHRAELFLRLLTIFTEMKPSICCGHLEDLLKIRTCVLRVNDMGGTKGVVLQNTILRILMLMASDPTCRAEVLSPEVLERVARVLLTVRGSHCLTLSDTAVKGLFAACRNGSSAMKVLLHVLGALARTSVRQIADMQAPASCAAADAKVAEGYEPEASCGDIECHVASPGPQASSQPVEEGEATCPHQASDQADGSRSAASTPAQLHRECAVLAQYFACIGSLALCQTAFIEHRMDVAQRMAESMPSKKNKQSDHAMAGVFHCSDIVDDQEALQSELLAALKPASRSVLKFCSSKLLLRASTSLRQHACICIMRLANIDSDIAERSLPVMFHLLHHGNRAQVEEVVARDILNGLADLVYYKPSIMKDYTKSLFGILTQDHHQHMRLHATQIIMKLVMSSALRFKEGAGELAFLLQDPDPRVQRQVEYLLKKLHEQDKHTVVSVFPDVLQRLCTSTMPAEHKDNILATLSQFVTLDKQTRNLVKVMLGRLMVEQDMSAAKYCLQGVFQLKSGAELGSSILDTLHQVCVAVPALAEKLEDKEFAKLILEKAKEALSMCTKNRKVDEGGVIQLQSQYDQIQEVIKSCLDEDEEQAADEGDERAAHAEDDVEMEDSEALDASQQSGHA